MTATDLTKLVEEKLSNILSGVTVRELTNENVSDFNRGRVRGKFEALNELLADIKKIKKEK